MREVQVELAAAKAATAASESELARPEGEEQTAMEAAHAQLAARHGEYAQQPATLDQAVAVVAHGATHKTVTKAITEESHSRATPRGACFCITLN